MAFTGKDLYGSGGKPQSKDIAQGDLGDCYFLAPLGAVAAHQPETIQNAIKYDDPTRSFEVTLYQPGANGQAQPVTVAVSQDDLRADSEVGVNDENSPNGRKSEPVWPQVMESAFAKFKAGQGATKSIQQELKEMGAGGVVAKTMYSLTGKPDETLFVTPSTDTAGLYSRLDQAIHEGRPLVLSTNPMKDFPHDGLIIGDWAKKSGHAYIVEGVSKDDDGAMQVILRNPWGTNNDSRQGVSRDNPIVTADLKQIIANGHLAGIDFGPAAGPQPGAALVADAGASTGIPILTGDTHTDRMIAAMNDPLALSQAMAELRDSSYGDAFRGEGRAMAQRAGVPPVPTLEDDLLSPKMSR